MIDRLQLKLLGTNIVYAGALTFLFVSVLFTPLLVTMYNDSTPEEQQLEAADRLLFLNKTIWPAVGLIAVLYCFHLLLSTHRVAGPLAGFRRLFDELRRGNLRVRARTRTYDYLKQESASINRMIDGLVERVRGIEDSLCQVQLATGELAEAHHRRDEDATTRGIERLEASLRGLEAEVGRFDLPIADRAAVPAELSVEPFGPSMHPEAEIPEPPFLGSEVLPDGSSGVGPDSTIPRR